MKITTLLKTLTLSGLTALTLAATSSQADNGYVYYGGNPNAASNPWNAAMPNANPWMNNQAMQQARFLAVMKQRQVQLDQRQDAQMQRILSGMDNGKLTAREAAGLIREHLSIANQERNYLADGRLGPNELSSLEKHLEEAERHIVMEMRDREKTSAVERPEDMRHQIDVGRPGDNRPQIVIGRPGEVRQQVDVGRPGDHDRR